MKLSTKLITGFTSVAAIALLVGALGYHGLNQSLANQKEILANANATRQAVDLARSAQVNFKIQVQDWKDILLRGHDSAAFEKYFAEFTKQEADTRKDLSDLKALMSKVGLSTTDVAAALQQHAELGVKYREALRSFSSTNEHSSAVVDSLVKGIDRPPTEAINGIVAAINKYAAECAAEIEKKSLTQAHTAQLASGIGVGGGVVISVILGLLLSLAVTKRVRTIASTLSAGAEQTASAAGQVSASSQSLAEGASEQAASLEETSSSLEEMSSMTHRNAENAHQASELAKQARTAADRGATDMQAMTAAMDAIKMSSDDIAKILKTIDEIAFQTNLLALNAAVEAARAGEAGMGFAVVADEVRNLAQRAAAAAKETAQKIDGAIGKSAQGVEISRKVAQALNDIVAKARQVDDLVAEVANASREQSQGITQINTAVGQMDKVTQANAANAEESAAAAEELNAQAETMRESVEGLLRLVGGNRQQAQAQARTPARPVDSLNRFGVKPPKTAAPAPGNGQHPVPQPPIQPASGRDAAMRRLEIPLESSFRNF